MNGMDLPSIKILTSVLDCLPSIVRKFWSSPWIAWKYVETSGQENLIPWHIFLEFQPESEAPLVVPEFQRYNSFLWFRHLTANSACATAIQNITEARTDHPKDPHEYNENNFLLFL
jgi:hypothetical protein